MIIKRFNDEKLKDIKNPTIIYGIGGGFGNIARIVGKRIIKEYKGELVGKFIIYGGYVDSFFVNKNGKILDIFSYKLYRIKINNEDFLIFSGYTQPFIPEDPLSSFALEHRYKLVWDFMKFAKKINAKELMLIGGFIPQEENLDYEDPKLFVLGNNLYDNKKLESLDIKFDLLKNIRMMGIPAIMLYTSRLFKIPTLSVWAQTLILPQLNDYLASYKIIEFLNKLYGFNINAQDFKEKGIKLKEKIKDKIEKLKRMNNNILIGNQNKDNKNNLSYYFG